MSRDGVARPLSMNERWRCEISASQASASWLRRRRSRQTRTRFPAGIAHGFGAPAAAFQLPRASSRRENFRRADDLGGNRGDDRRCGILTAPDRAETETSHAATLQTIAENYIAFWNAADPAERRELLRGGLAARRDLRRSRSCAAPAPRRSARWSPARSNASPASPSVSSAPADGHGDFVRFRWALGPAGAEAPIEGSDVVRLSDGRIAEVIGFLDKLPS